MISFWINIYADYAETDTYFSSGLTNDSLTFSTTLNGGFESASFSISNDPSKVFILYSSMLNMHCVIYDSLFNRAFEGYISGMTLQGSTLSVRSVGYYAKGKDIIDDRIYVTSPTTISDILMDACGLIDPWVESEAWQGGASYDLMVTDTDTGALLALDFTDKKITEAIESVLVYGYDSTTPQQVYVAIYENRIPRIIFPFEADTDIDDASYYINKSNIVGSFPDMSVNLENIFNKVYAIYANESDGRSKTTAANDLISQAKFGIREGVVQNGGNPEGIAMANALRDYALEKYAWPIQSTTLDVAGVVYLGGGRAQLPHLLRAGDMIRLLDVDPMAILGENYNTVIRSRVYSQIMQTNYNAQTRVNSLTLGVSDGSFDVLMARLGLSGGLQ